MSLKDISDWRSLLDPTCQIPTDVVLVVTEELKNYFYGDLNPVAPKAQKKVPIPEGLDLDVWINQPEEESSDEEPDSLGGQVFVKDEQESYKKRNIPEPTEEELLACRQVRLQNQTSNPNYLRDTPKVSPARSGTSVGEIPVQVIYLNLYLFVYDIPPLPANICLFPF